MNSKRIYNGKRPDNENSKKSSQQSSSKRASWQKVAISLLLVVCILLNGIYAVYNSFMDRINFVDSGQNVTFSDIDVSDTDIDDSDNIPDDVIVSTDAVSFYLLIGADSRLGIDAQSRSDSMIIAAIDRTHKKIKLISLMRDMLLKVQGRGYDRINSAYSSDSGRKDTSLTRTRKAIKDNFGIDIEKYVVIDFEGFEKMIDMMGGITLEVNSVEAKYMCSNAKYGWFKRFSAGAGTYTMSGAEALNYARIRKVGNGDFERTERQRKIIALMIEKMRDQSYLQLAGMVKEGLGYVTTTVPQGEILGLAFDAPTLLNYEIVQYRIPVDGSFTFKSVMLGGSEASVIWPNYKWNASQLSKFIFDDDMTYANTAKRANKVGIPALPSSVKVAGSDEKNNGENADSTTTTTTKSPNNSNNTGDTKDFYSDTNNAA